jgi:hypothetical protein
MSDAVLFSLQIDAIDYKKVKAREPKLRRKAVEAALTLWRNTYLPMHFGPQAATRYGYAPRKFSYLYQSKRQLRHLRPRDNWNELYPDRQPNELTGTLRRAVTSNKPRFTEQKKGGKSLILLKVNAPKHLYYRVKRKDGSRTPHKGDELSKILPQEFEVMQAKYKEVYMAALESEFEAETNRLSKRARAGARRAMRDRAVRMAA